MLNRDSKKVRSNVPLSACLEHRGAFTEAQSILSRLPEISVARNQQGGPSSWENA
jgi:hypothetical protein